MDDEVVMYWNWTEFCSTGVRPFAGDSNDLLPCFQEIVLQIPIYAIFATISAYKFGSYTRSVLRDVLQLRLLYLRIGVTIVLAQLPIWKIFVFHHTGVKLYPVDVLVVAAECLMWAVHVGYLLSKRRFGGLSHRSSLCMNVAWLAVVVLDMVWLRTSINYDWWPWSLVTVIFDLIYGLTLIPTGNAVLATTRYPSAREDESLLANRYTYFHFDMNETHLGHAQDEASYPSCFIFSWVDPLITKGVAGGLKKIEDLFDLPDALNITQLSERLQVCISQTKTLFWALHKGFGREFYLIGILRFTADIAGFAGPLLLGGLLKQQNENDNGETSWSPYLYALGLCATSWLSAICSTHFSWRMSMIGMKMRIGLVSAIYRKSLEARGLKNSKPEILNLMSTDTERIVNSCISFHSFWSIPFQLFTTLYLLYTQLGAAFLAGLIFGIVLIPINRLLAQRIGQYSRGLMSAKDLRLAATSETMCGAKQIKLHAWEDIFIEKIRAYRKEEVKFLKKRKYLDALCVYFWATTPVLMSFLTFGTSVLMGNPLVAASTYTSVALLNMLIGPLNAFPWVLNGLIEAWVSVKRVQELIDLPNLDFSSYYNPIIKSTGCGTSTKLDEKPTVLEMKSATFEHENGVKNGADEHLQRIFRLENVNLTVKKGDLICLEGPVGGGKSAFIDAIVASVNCISGSVCVHELTSGFGYVPQTPWLQRGTIRDNIIWGNVFDEQWYKAVLYACALNEDLELLGGDLIGIGENGRTLSGGQRARVALARAVYQNKKIYLLDDILASLDAHVARHIIKYCILGLLKEKTRFVVTRSVSLFYHAHQILHIEDGKVTQSQYMSESVDIHLDLDEETIDDIYDYTRRSSIDLDEQNSPDKKSVDSIMLEESREYGKISLNVLSCYWRAIGTPLACTTLTFVVLMQLTRNLSDAWLAHWVTDTTLDPQNNVTGLTHIVSVPHQQDVGNHTEPTHNTSYYLGIFASLAALNSISTIARAFLFASAGIKAAKYIHDRLLRKVLFAKFNFFDITSVGRIINRFSSDTYTVDDSLPFIMNILLAQLLGLAGALCISLYAMPWLGLIIIPMVPIYLNLQYRYRYASRDIKRLSSNALSPLYTHFTETLQGLVTIRTMRASARFQRDFHAKLEESIKAQLTSTAAQQWLSLRLQLLGVFLVAGAGFLAAITSAHVTNPGLVGLAISYALSITGLLGGLLNAVAETEQEFVAIERVNEYLQLEGEENAEGTCDPPFGWPSQGALKFQNVELRYRDNLAPALHDINLRTEAFERVGIVGRTGAGKTTLVAALMRVAPLSRGEITLDCVNLKTLALKVLRERLGIIPQEPFLFEGTVRENLDPRCSHYDSEIWHALASCHAATQLVQSLGGLDGRIEKGGINLSAGQRQLMCLARGLLKNAKVVCIDEGTSNLDDESAIAMQQALRNSFKSSTVLFIAHRLRGLQLMDRIIVIEHGEIKEEGTPQDLAQNTQSLFHGMLQAQQINVEEFCAN
ncbi:PREDICTED: multidrug resistance-associated protein 7 [Rhagoletis zephyria]|uniref:multidrug resistance-associated protein 7 n=1 Tax=Rhagoletis zephyria TaxID=28612 RepID=UPI000811530E|nr:PREDICTED: multidrug resistance-associated protein 7 [Rhagoletis zephyria]